MPPLRALLLVAGLAAAVALAILVWPAPAPAPADAGSPARSTTPRDAGPAAPIRPVVESLPGPTEEDLWAMTPDDAGLQEIRRWEFDMQGGASTPGTDPEGARREVDEPGWAERFEQELGRGLESTVAGPGVEIPRVDCGDGRCLVELRFDSMLTGTGRIAAIRQWLRGEVRCPAYTDGPLEEDAPQLRPEQQIWILCGQPQAGDGAPAVRARR